MRKPVTSGAFTAWLHPFPSMIVNDYPISRDTIPTSSLMKKRSWGVNVGGWLQARLEDYKLGSRIEAQLTNLRDGLSLKYGGK